MEPKAKAKELIQKFIDVSRHEDFEAIRVSKNCALIAVNELYAEVANQSKDWIDDFRLMYWQQVKEEINKL